MSISKMSCDGWKLEDDLCRCCHSEGSFKNLSKGDNIDNVDEIYVEMLKYTLDIHIAPALGALCTATYTICEPCILKLQEATTFKKQVLHCEEKFKDMYAKNFIKVAAVADVEIKDEPPEENEAAQQGVPVKTGDDVHIKDDERVKKDDGDDEYANKRVMNEGKKRSKRTPSKSKSQPKPKKPPKRGRPRKGEAVTAEKIEGGKTAVSQTFRLQENDYKRDGDTYMCSRCDKKYDKIFSLKFHVKTKHYKIPRFFCPYCMKEFMTPAPLTVHKLEEHDIDDRFKCNACKGTFNTKVQLRKHINNFHMLGEKHKCDFCDYESFSFESMYKHKFKHKTVKDYHCRFCKKSFLRKTTLDLHERIHTGDRRKVCKVCGQTFVQKASLNYHMTKYHPEVNF